VPVRFALIGLAGVDHGLHVVGASKRLISNGKS